MTALPAPLNATQSKLVMHFQRTGVILAAAVDISVNVRVDVDWALPTIVGGLNGAGCEFIPRNRGLRVPVALLLQLQQGLWAWLGYREEWDEERRIRDIRRFSFRSVGLTIHFGLKNDVFKPQMFRAEWAGWAKWSGVEYSFQAADAGHPHWQFDALDSLPDADLAERAATLRSRLKAEAEPEVHEFSPQLPNTDVRDMVSAQKLSRIHFASAAAWWKSAPHDEHAHSPADLADVENWVRRSLDYVSLELKRL
ncbi:MAG: hypothetical protein IIA73_01520 [Proteobacteria bacterium]|nr:hypothetical protein [Pseudomonadota bacterium]